MLRFEPKSTAQWAHRVPRRPSIQIQIRLGGNECTQHSRAKSVQNGTKLNMSLGGTHWRQTNPICWSQVPVVNKNETKTQLFSSPNIPTDVSISRSRKNTMRLTSNLDEQDVSRLKGLLSHPLCRLKLRFVCLETTFNRSKHKTTYYFSKQDNKYSISNLQSKSLIRSIGNTN